MRREDLIAEIARRVTAAVDQAVQSFIAKMEVEKGFPSTDELIDHGQFVQIDGEPKLRFFVWRKHNVLMIRYGSTAEPTALTFCHLYPDDWPDWVYQPQHRRAAWPYIPPA